MTNIKEKSIDDRFR